MPRANKSSYTSKQKRQAEHLEERYKKRGGSASGKKSGSGRGKKTIRISSRKAGRKGGHGTQKKAA